MTCTCMLCISSCFVNYIGSKSFGRGAWGQTDGSAERGGGGREWGTQSGCGDDSFTMSVASSDVGRIIGVSGALTSLCTCIHTCVYTVKPISGEEHCL